MWFMDFLLSEFDTASVDTSVATPQQGEDYLHFLDSNMPRIARSHADRNTHYKKITHYIYELQFVEAYTTALLDQGFIQEDTNIAALLAVGRTESLGKDIYPRNRVGDLIHGLHSHLPIVERQMIVDAENRAFVLQARGSKHFFENPLAFTKTLQQLNSGDDNIMQQGS